MHRGVSAPWCCAFIHRVSFEEVSGIGFLSRADREIGVFQHVAPPTRLSLEFPRETGLILRCTGKVGNPFQTKQGNRPSCCDQEGRRGSDDVVPGTWVFPSSEACMSGNFGGAIMGAKYRFALQSERGTSLETPSRARASCCEDDGTTWFFYCCGGILGLRRGSQPSSWVGPGKPNLPLELRGKAGGCARVTAGPKRPHLGVCLGPNIPLQGRQGSRGCISGSLGESGLVSRGSKGLRSPLELRRVSLGAN